MRSALDDFNAHNSHVFPTARVHKRRQLSPAYRSIPIFIPIKMAKKPIKGSKAHRLNGPTKGRVAKLGLPKRTNGSTNGKAPKLAKSRKKPVKRHHTEIEEDDSVVVKKKPSKVELKSVIEALQKEANLLMARKALKYVPFYLKSEGLTKKLLKEMIRLWAEASEKIRVICLLCLIRIYTKVQDKEKKQMVIKKLYTTFLEKCRVTKYETMSMIGFMRHSLIELYKIDPEIAFKQAQASCQQLTITLKNAHNHKNEETYKSVLNWQFANCLILLSQLITSLDDENPIRSLTQQVVQLNLGAINLLTSPRYYPYYCHLIENLIHLGISAKIFIPVLPLLLSILTRLSFPFEKKKTKGNSKDKVETKTKRTQPKNQKKNGSGGDDDDDEEEVEESEEEDEDGEEDVESDEEKPQKEYNMELLNHVSLDEAHNFSYQEATLNKIYELMLLYLSSQCHKIAFPELVFLPCVQLKKWLKSNPARPAQKIRVLLDKIKSDCEQIEEARRSVDFAFTNYSAVDAWEKKMTDSNKLSLPKLLQSEQKDK